MEVSAWKKVRIETNSTELCTLWEMDVILGGIIAGNDALEWGNLIYLPASLVHISFWKTFWQFVASV